MNPRSTPSATMTTSTGSPRRSRFGMEFSPVPMEVAAVTTFFFVRSSSRGMSSRYAAVKAPEVMTRMSSIVFMVVIYFDRVRFLKTGTLERLERSSYKSDWLIVIVRQTAASIGDSGARRKLCGRRTPDNGRLAGFSCSFRLI